MPDLDVDHLKKVFFQDADEQLELMENGILELENQGENRHIIDEIFRMAHSLKGGAGALGYTEISALTHEMESVLECLREGTLALDEDIIELLFISVDSLKEFKDDLEAGMVNKDSEDGIKELINRYTNMNFSNTIGKKNPQLYSGKIPLNTKEIEYLDQVEPPLNIFLIDFALQNEREMQSIVAFLVANNLKKIGRIIKSLPPNIDGQIGELPKFSFIFEVERCQKDLEIFIEKIVESEDFTVYPWRKLGEERYRFIEELKDTFQARTVSRETVRIDIEKIDHLMKLVGELVIDKEHLLELAGRMKSHHKGNREIQALLQTIPHVDYIANELHEAVMDIRMYPVGSIFRRFPRLVRDISKQMGKTVRLEMSGEDTEIDRTILQEIFDPLVHILRNAVDHGLEYPEERKEQGKALEGVVSLSAWQEENYIVIEVNDDGRGIDIEKVKEKAFALGLYSKESLAEMTESAIFELLLEPGFSTAETVSDVSGRGVGMDVVKNNIEKINGRIEIASKKGKGTGVKIILPLTMAIIKALMVREGNSDYAIPLSSVIETVVIGSREGNNLIKTIQNKEVITWREMIVPIIRLNDFFELNHAEDRGKYAVIVGIKDKPVGIIVESLLGEQEIVIKPLGDYLGAGTICGIVPGISGATIKGDGRIALILDIQSMLKTFRNEGKRQELLIAEGV